MRFNKTVCQDESGKCGWPSRPSWDLLNLKLVHFRWAGALLPRVPSCMLVSRDVNVISRAARAARLCASFRLWHQLTVRLKSAFTVSLHFKTCRASSTSEGTQNVWEFGSCTVTCFICTYLILSFKSLHWRGTICTLDLRGFESEGLAVSV